MSRGCASLATRVGLCRVASRRCIPIPCLAWPYLVSCADTSGLVSCRVVSRVALDAGYVLGGMFGLFFSGLETPGGAGYSGVHAPQVKGIPATPGQLAFQEQTVKVWLSHCSPHHHHHHHRHHELPPSQLLVFVLSFGSQGCDEIIETFLIGKAVLRARQFSLLPILTD
jgi:hypothetical protein